jgi:kynurenine formamidase
MTNKKVFLSYLLNENTPSYGNRNQFIIEKKSDISNGDIANDSSIKSTVHIGTHIDMPYHFYQDGQTIVDFDIDFWFFSKILFVEIEQKDLIICSELIDKLENTISDDYEMILVKTGICHKRGEKIFWEKNPGFSPEVANYIRKKFPKVRVFGFDSISVSSFAYRMIGRDAHKAFLDPKKPILLLEDMDLREISENHKIQKIIIAPLRIKKCDGLPCTVVAEVEK